MKIFIFIKLKSNQSFDKKTRPKDIYCIYKDNLKKTVEVFTTDIEKFEPKPDWSDTGIVKLFDKLPKKLFYDDLIYEKILYYK